ncbi:MAG: hypothetical protein ACLUFV_09135 [Acutalibacteraceae bacterium]
MGWSPRWGSDTICVLSQHQGRERAAGNDHSLLRYDGARPTLRAAKGVVIEAKLDKNRSAVATVLVQNGTLKNGDIVIAGTATGRVRMMTNDKGERERGRPLLPRRNYGPVEAPNAGACSTPSPTSGWRGW